MNAVSHGKYISKYTFFAILSTQSGQYGANLSSCHQSDSQNFFSIYAAVIHTQDGRGSHKTARMRIQ